MPFRQNYVVASALIVAVWFAYSVEMRSEPAFVSAIRLPWGRSCLLLLIWINERLAMAWFLRAPSDVSIRRVHHAAVS